LKNKAPVNFLGEFLTKNNIANIDIHAKTSIPTSELSKIRNGEISNISAAKLYLISLAIGINVGDVLLKIYPHLQIINTTTHSAEKALTNFGSLLESLRGISLKEVAIKTGIKLSRLNDLSKKSSAIVYSHELYLIELVCNKEPGTYFIELFSGAKLNPREIEIELRNKEKIRSAKRSKF
jgi:transcriptional regulator with XRE-family HTH domain